MTALLVLLALGQSSVDDALAKNAKAILDKHCAKCHGKDAPRGGISVVDWDALRKSGVVSKTPDASELVWLVEAGNMPPGNAPSPSKEERQLLRKWIESGAPNIPPPVVPPSTGDDYVLKQIAADWGKLPKAQQAKMRYITLEHLLILPDGRKRLDATRKHLERVLTGLAGPGKGDAKLMPIDGKQASVFRIDLTELGWDRRPFQIPPDTAKGKPRPSSLNLWDVVLLEYPLALVSFSKPFEQNVNFLAATQSIRPIVYLRGDWLLGLLNDRTFAREMSLMAGHESMAELPEPVPDDISGAPVTLNQARAELSWKGEEARLKEVLRSEGLDELAADNTVTRALWNVKFPTVIKRLGLGTPLLPWDGLTMPDGYDDPTMTVTVQTMLYQMAKLDKNKKVVQPGQPIRPTKVIRFNERLALAIKPSKDAMVEIALKDHNLETDSMAGPLFVEGSKTFLLDNRQRGFEVEPPAAKENWIVYVFAGREGYRGETHRATGLKAKVRDRFVHSFYRLSENGKGFEKSMPPTVKVTETFETKDEEKE